MGMLSRSSFALASASFRSMSVGAESSAKPRSVSFLSFGIEEPSSARRERRVMRCFEPIVSSDNDGISTGCERKRSLPAKELTEATTNDAILFIEVDAPAYDRRPITLYPVEGP
jgi:hypothetical protein